MDIYRKWKSITDKMYAHDLSQTEAAMKLVFLLQAQGIKVRPGHEMKVFSTFVYDKETYAISDPKPLGLGITYEKPNGVLTQDIFIVNPQDNPERIEAYYSEKGMVQKYPSLKGVHKVNLPIPITE